MKIVDCTDPGEQNYLRWEHHLSSERSKQKVTCALVLQQRLGKERKNHTYIATQTRTWAIAGPSPVI
jgi:hypothetical protein